VNSSIGCYWIPLATLCGKWYPVATIKVARSEERVVQVILEESAQLRGRFTQR